MKGVSAIIATILLLMITIALAGTAYIYMSGMIGGRTFKTISVLDASCTGTSRNITLVISNDGTTQITITDDLKFFVDNTQTIFYPSSGDIDQHETQVFVDRPTSRTSGSYTILVVSPSNAIRQVVYC